MLKYFIFLILIFYAKSQTFCDPDTKPVQPEVQIPQPDPLDQYQVDVEKNDRQEKSTLEFREYFDGKNDLGIVVQELFGTRFITYSYYQSNEILIVNGQNCLVKMLNESLDASLFFVVIDDKGKEQIVSPLTFLLKNSKPIYIGKSDISGIPVNQWLFCTKDKDNKEYKITVSYSDKDQWTPPLFSPGHESIPIRAIVETQRKDVDQVYKDSIVYTFSRFRPGPLVDEEEYFVHSGVYCPGRKNLKPLPTIPDAFSYWVQRSDAKVDSGDLAGTVQTFRGEHDFNKKLFRLDTFNDNKRKTEIHDYNTGLSYKINRHEESCVIETLGDNNYQNEAQSPADLFKFDSDPQNPFQYVGMRRVRGINTDVWIAPRSFMGLNGTWEWHFMTDQWAVQETNAVEKNEPVLLLMTLNNPVKYDKGNVQMKKVEKFFHIMKFDQSRIDLYDFDIAVCNKEIANKHLKFTITSNSYDLMKTNQASVKDGIMNALQSVAKVSLLRISKLETLYDDNIVTVLFTLFERPKQYGNPNHPEENSLDEALNSIKESISNGKFLISFNDEFEKSFGVSADSKSFEDLASRSRYVYKEVKTGKTIGYSGASVAGFIIGFLILGLLVGFLLGFFLIIKRNQPFTGALSFFNPNFKSSS